MKKAFVIFISVFSFYILNAQLPNFQWAKNMGGPASNAGSLSTSTDALGNVYTTGYFTGVTNFDIGVSNFTLNAPSIGIFVTKLDAYGNFNWTKQIGGYNNEVVHSLALDGSGNIYITGDFLDTVDFNPGIGVFNLISKPGYQSMFILKLDPNGNFIWAKQMHAAIYCSGYSISVDPTGNIYTTGEFADTVDFDPGVGVTNLFAKGTDIFISKLNSAGNFIWAKQMKGKSIQNSYGNSIANDLMGNVLISGKFKDTVDFDPGVGTFNLVSLGNPGNSEAFVAKYNSNGNLTWAKQFGAAFKDEEAMSLTTDLSNNVYTVGYFTGLTDFDPGIAVYNLNLLGYLDFFISKLDASGNFIWATSIGAAGGLTYANAIKFDNTSGPGNIYITGTFSNTTDFDPSLANYNLSSFGLEDTYILKMDGNGNFVWAAQIGGGSSDIAHSIAVNSINEVITVGEFNGSCDFNPGVGTSIINPFMNDAFIQKMSYAPTDVAEVKSQSSLFIFPNPASDKINIAYKKIADAIHIKLINLIGQTISEKKYLTEVKFSLDISELIPGIYFLEINDQDKISRYKIIKE